MQNIVSIYLALDHTAHTSPAPIPTEIKGPPIACVHREGQALTTGKVSGP
jgi:hypothetical protein